MGKEFRVNTYTNNAQRHPDVIALQDGGFMVFWDSVISQDPDFPFETRYIAAQRYTANGTAIGAELVIDAGRDAASHEVRATTLADGGYAVTFSYSKDGSLNHNVTQTRVFDSGGTERTATAVNVPTHSFTDTRSPDVATLANGGYMAFFTGETSGTDSPDIYARRFTSAGDAVGADIKINTAVTRLDQANPQVAALTQGRFLVLWSSEGTLNTPAPTDSNEIRGTLFAANGTPLRADFGLTKDHGIAGSGANTEAGVTGLSNGGFVISTCDVKQGAAATSTDFGIYLHFFDASGNATSGPVFAFGPSGSGPKNTSLIQLENGQVLVTWESTTANLQSDVRGRLFDTSGHALTAAFQIAEHQVDQQTTPRAAALAGGGFIVTWASEAIDPDGSGISARIFGRGTLGNDVAFMDVTGSYAGLGGHDRITGNTAANTLQGGSGNDTLLGGANTDRILGGSGNDRLIGGSGADTLSGGAGADQFVFNTAASTTNLDRITGFDSTDKILIDNAHFAALGQEGALKPGYFKTLGTVDANDHLIYNRATGVLSYDSNGSATGGRVAIAVLLTHPVLTYDDILVI